MIREFNVRAYGAAGDGTTDDTAAIQAADAAAVAAGGTLFFPDSDYLITRSTIGTLASEQVAFGENVTFSDPDSGDQFRPEVLEVEANPKYLFHPYKSKWHPVIRNREPLVICYGDSNTRYFEGDTATAGPVQNSWGIFVSVLSLAYSGIAGLKVTVSGHPGETAQFGDTNFSTFVSGSPDAVVLGWGTNNVKDPTLTLTSYLTAMESMIGKILDGNGLPIVLAIPDFQDTYATDGVTGRHRIKVWNTYLARLCQRYNVPLIDTYAMFNDFKTSQAATWYNEATIWRHYSKYANNLIAAELCRILRDRAITADVPMQWRWSLRAGDPLLGVSFGVTETEFTLSDYRYCTLQLSNTDSGTVKFRAGGDAIIIGFYPRSDAGVAQITVKRPDGTTIATETFDTYGATTDGLFMPITKYLYRIGGLHTDVVVEVTPNGTKNASSTGFDLFMVAVAAPRLIAWGPAYTTSSDEPTITGLIPSVGRTLYSSANGLLYYLHHQSDVHPIQPIRHSVTASRPPSPTAGQMHFDDTLGKPIWWNSANWVDATGATV